MAGVATFGDALKRLRRGKMTQEALARASGIPRATIAGLESDKAAEPRWDTAVAIARGLNMSLDAFVDAAALAKDLSKAAGVDRLELLEAQVAAIPELQRELAALNRRVTLLVGQQPYQAEQPPGDTP